VTRAPPRQEPAGQVADGSTAVHAEARLGQP